MNRPRPHDDERLDERLALVRAIEAEAKLISRSPPEVSVSRRVLDAIARVPRHEFMSPAQADFAYEDEALPIGRGQTISQPFVVAYMTELTRVAPGAVVLDVGTGSGYQAAVLAELASRVYGIELDAVLARDAASRMARLGYANVEIRVGDGRAGWPEHAPFAAIVVAAATPEVPAALLAQLAPGGRLVIPLGARFGPQRLRVFAKDASGHTTACDDLPVAFVPLRAGGEHE